MTDGPIIVVALLVIFGILLNLITVPLGTFVIRHPKKNNDDGFTFLQPSKCASVH